MKKTDTPHRDPNLKNLLKNIEVPGVPKDFSKLVMESVKESVIQYKDYSFKAPMGIKVGIPVFMVICLLLILIFAGNQQDPISTFLNTFSGSSFLNFFDKISDSIQTLNFPDITISNDAVYYTLGGIGLLWMYVIFDRFTSHTKKKNISS